MARFAIVVTDPEKTAAFEHRRHVEAFTRGGGAPELAQAFAVEHAPKEGARPKGFVHTEMDDACPLGRPNCRHCGDPNHADACRAAGHCPDCGTLHGIAPDAVLAAHGFTLEPR